MGYLPYGNASADPQENWPGWWSVPDFGSRLDEKLLALYVWCRDNGVPILAHSSHSQGATVGSAALAGPDGWRNAFAACPGLKVYLGHFGGDNEYSSANHFIWAQQFLDLMREPVAVNLHADISYFSGLLTADSGAETVLRNALSSDLAARFMYGSDWHLLVLESGALSYASRVAELLATIGNPSRVAQLRRSVFYESAVTFYGLRSGGATRQRLDAFYARNNVPRPAWMGAVDANPLTDLTQSEL